MQNTPQQMKAMAVDEFGGPDKLYEYTLPVPTVHGRRRHFHLKRRHKRSQL
ncbi:MAG: hypothetical protein PUP91_24750 [Rhizonema sp. PD37]|nr:hypothetical protein [Rhizonema sp. PD37]